MRTIVTVVTVDDFETDPSEVWKQGKILVLQNKYLRSDFITRFLQKEKNIRTVDPTFPTIDIATAASDVCANCGKAGGGDGIKLKNCTACFLVKYCSVDCQKRNHKAHKNACCKRSAVLKDEGK